VAIFEPLGKRRTPVALPVGQPRMMASNQIGEDPAHLVELVKRMKSASRGMVHPARSSFNVSVYAPCCTNVALEIR